MNMGTVSKADSTLFHRSPSAADGSLWSIRLELFDKTVAVASETRLSYFASDLLAAVPLRRIFTRFAGGMR